MAKTATLLSRENKRRLLARLSFELTIAARNTYIAGSDDVAAPRQLRAYNEIQHRVTSCLVNMLDHDTDNLWIWPVIAEWSETAGCGEEVRTACSRALASVAQD